MMVATTEYLCSLCENHFDLETGEYPAELDGHIVCDDCECEHRHFACARCGDCGDVAVQHRYLVVADAAAVGLRLPGLYRVDATPYYWHGMLEAGVYAHRVTWLGFCEEAACADPYPCGHLCAGCQREVLQTLAQQNACLLWAAQPVSVEGYARR